jgi:large subunit ribosomal protein L10e
MALRKALSYSSKPARPYTRKSKKKNKSYIKSVPFSKIVKFDGGDRKAFEAGKHNYQVSIFSEEWSQVRDNAIEACRQFLIKNMETQAPGQFYLEVKMHPHHMMRENKSVAAVAGADRLSSGMTRSFGTVIGRAAIVKAGKEMIFVSCADDRVARIARDSLSQLKSKLPCRTRVVFKKLR